jgi:hypothetical protein
LDAKSSLLLLSASIVGGLRNHGDEDDLRHSFLY